jgi:mannose-6-phosphate isomerase-like protein (cupin superfamily)
LKLHRHPDAEIFIVQEGHATFTVGDEAIDASGGKMLIVLASVPHKFINTGIGSLPQIDIRMSDHFVTE